MDNLQNPPSENLLLLKELSDIKEKLAINTTKTAGIENIVFGIQTDLKAFQTLFPTREEFKILKDSDADKEIRLRSLEQNVWKAIGALAILEIVLPIILFFIKK